MFERVILGLDVGSYSVKAAELRAGLRGVELVRFCAQVLPANAPPEEREAAIFGFLQQENLPLDYVITALPADRVTQRHLRFPFNDRRRIEQALPFEVGDELPVGLDELILTYEQTRVGPDQTDVLAVVSPRGEVAAWLQQLSLAGVDPRILELDGAVLANLSAALHESDLARLILDVGHRTTNLCLVVDGKPVALRAIPIAGQHLTEGLASDLKLSLPQALERKHTFGVFEANRPVGPAVAQALDRLVRETRRTLEAVVGDPLHAIAPAEIVLVGGSAALAGLDGYVEQMLGLPCAPIEVPLGDPELEPLSEAGPAVFAQATALALRGAPTARVTHFDFRSGEFAYTPDLGDLRRSLGFTIALVAAVLVLLVSNLAVELWARERRADALAEQLGGVYSLTFGDDAGGADPFASMEQRVRETRDLANHLGVTGNGLSALEVLREISARIPPDLEVALTELNIERRTIQARGHARDFESVDRIRADLSQYEEFADVRLTDVVTDPRLGGKSFNLTIRFLEDS